MSTGRKDYMRVLNGKYTSAKIFTDTIEEYALAQLQMLVDHPVFQGSRIRIMPDVHPGKVGTIGFTATVELFCTARSRQDNETAGCEGRIYRISV